MNAQLDRLEILKRDISPNPSPPNPTQLSSNPRVDSATATEMKRRVMNRKMQSGGASDFTGYDDEDEDDDDDDDAEEELRSYVHEPASKKRPAGSPAYEPASKRAAAGARAPSSAGTCTIM